MFDWGVALSLTSLESTLWKVVCDTVLEEMSKHKSQSNEALIYTIKYTSQRLIGRVTKEEDKYLRVVARYRDDMFKREVIHCFEEALKHFEYQNKGFDVFESQRGNLAEFTHPKPLREEDLLEE